MVNNLTTVRGKFSRKAVVLTVCAALIAAGCETAGQSAGLGAVIGGGAGALIGHQSGHAVEGALIGAAIGGLAGWGIHKVRARQTRSAAETATAHNYEPSQGVKVAMTEGTSVAPNAVPAGGKVTATMEYAALGTGPNGIPVRERFLLNKDGEQVKELYDSTVTRTDGTWQSPIEFTLPEKAPVGTYVVAQSASAGGRIASKDVAFTVKQATAKGPNGEPLYVVAMAN